MKEDAHITESVQGRPAGDTEAISLEYISPEEIFDWYDKLPGTKINPSPERYWGAGIVGRDAPHAGEADTGIFARLNGEIVGASIAIINPHEKAKLVGVYVLPKFWQKGIGKKLTTTVLEKMISEGCDRIAVDAADTRALEMLENLPENLRKHLDIKDVRRD